MKKIKLLTSLGSISAFVAVAASSTANTSTKIINNQTLKTEIGNYEVVCFDFPKKVYVGELTTLDLNLITIDGSLILDLVWIVESANPCLNVEAKEGNLIINPTIDAIGKKNTIKLTAQYDDKEISGLSFVIDNVCLTPSRMTYDGVEYNLADDIDPNLFITCKTTVGNRLTQEIPLANGSTISIGDHVYPWSKLTSLTLGSCDTNVYTIGDYFLAECTGLTSLELTGLEYVTKFGASFLADDVSLMSLILPNKPATTYDVGIRGFLEDFPTNAVINCGMQLYSYQHTAPWSVFSKQMIGKEAKYVISDFHWTNNYMVSDFDKICVDETTTASPKLSLNTIELDNVVWEIGEKTDESLNASIEGNVISIVPSIETVEKQTVPFVLNAYINNELAISHTYELAGKFTSSGIMVYDRKQYELADNNDPNRFITKEFLLSKTQHIWLKDNTIKEIGGSDKEWGKLQALKLNKVDPTITSIDSEFLCSCNGLTTIDLSGLSNITEIDVNFITGAQLHVVKWLTLPKCDPSNITIHWFGGKSFMGSVNNEAVIHCGEYLEQYKTTYGWSSYAPMMVK